MYVHVAVIVLALLASGPPEWETLNAEGNALRARGSYRDALRRYLEALSALQGRGETGQPSAIVLNNIGAARISLGDFGRAAADLEASRQIFEKVQPGQPDNALVLLNLATLWRKLHRYGDAAEQSRRATEILQLAYTLKHPEVAISLNLEGEIAFLDGRCADAGRQFQLARSIWHETLGANNVYEGLVLNNLASAELCLGHAGPGLDFAIESLRVQRRTLPARHPEFVQTLDNCAVALERLGRKKEARPYRREATAIFRENERENVTGFVVDARSFQRPYSPSRKKQTALPAR